MTKTDNAAEVGLHVFERAGLGAAPFRCVGFSELVFKNPDGTTRAGGSCDYCATGIRYACHIKGSDGRTFKVGTDCVARTGDAGLIKSYKTNPDVRAANRAKAKAKDDAVRAEWDALIEAPATVEKLSATMVPGRPWVPGETVPLLDSMKRLWNMCGAAGRKRTLGTLKFHIEKIKRPDPLYLLKVMPHISFERRPLVTTHFEAGRAAYHAGKGETDNPFLRGVTKLGAPKFFDAEAGAAWYAGWLSEKPARVSTKKEIAAAATVDVTRFRRKSNRYYGG